MNILVTGSTGFLGTGLVHRLIAEGHSVKALARKTSDISEFRSYTDSKFRSQFQIVYGDVTDPNSLNLAMKGVDTVFHLASLISYRRSDRNKMEAINVQGTQNVIQSCIDNQISRWIYMSSVVAIGAGFTKNDILTESSKYNLSHLNLGYFETKRKAEELVRKSCQENKNQIIILNPSTIYGPGDSKKGTRSVQKKVALGKFPFYPLGGVNVVDLDDVLDAMIFSLNHGKSGERYILAGENILIRDLFRMIAEEAQQRPPYIPLPFSFLWTLGTISDFMSSYGLSSSISVESAWSSRLYNWFDSTKAQKELGFKPRPAREAIKKSIQWMKENGVLP